MSGAATPPMDSYQAACAAFADEVARRGLGDVRDLLWYHTIDLGDGLVTPGNFDLRDSLDGYGFPENARRPTGGRLTNPLPY